MTGISRSHDLLTRLQIGHSLIPRFFQNPLSSNGLWMLLSVDVLANIRPLLEVFVRLLIVLFVLVENADVNVEATSEWMVFAKRQFCQFHHPIVKLLLFRPSARRENAWEIRKPGVINIMLTRTLGDGAKPKCPFPTNFSTGVTRTDE